MTNIEGLKRRIEKVQGKMNPEGRLLVADGAKDEFHLPNDYDADKDILVILNRFSNPNYPDGKIPKIILRGSPLPYGAGASKEQRDAAVAAAIRADI